MTVPLDLDQQLAALAAGRCEAGQRIVAAARDAGIGAVLQVGSLGARGGDAFSDLDLVLVPGPDYTGLNLAGVFGTQILAELSAPRDAPRGGAHSCLCLQVADAVLWLDVYEWPAKTAALPADTIVVYSNLHLPYSNLGFVALLNLHIDPAAPTPAETPAAQLLQIAVAAKYLARGHRAMIVDTLPQAAGTPLDQIAVMLRDQLAAITEPGLARAVAATAGLVDLAETARTRGTRR